MPLAMVCDPSSFTQLSIILSNLNPVLWSVSAGTMALMYPNTNMLMWDGKHSLTIPWSCGNQDKENRVVIRTSFMKYKRVAASHRTTSTYFTTQRRSKHKHVALHFVVNVGQFVEDPSLSFAFGVFAVAVPVLNIVKGQQNALPSIRISQQLLANGGSNSSLAIFERIGQ